MTAGERAREHAEVFARVRSSPSFDAAVRRAPDLPIPGSVIAPAVIGAACAVLLGIVLICFLAPGNDGQGLRSQYAPDREWIVTVAVGEAASLAVSVWGGIRCARFRRAPRIALPAVVVMKRHAGEAVRGGGARYFMEFEFDSLGRREERIDVDTFGDARPGEAGVAWLQGGRFLAFRRIDL